MGVVKRTSFRLFSWRSVVVTLIVAIITGWAVNGPLWGTVYLSHLIPSVTIPDQTQNYAPDQLPGFFQAMGDHGRAAYITINNLDFLFIASYSLFVFIAFGTMLRFLMSHKPLATRLAFFGLLAGLFDFIESSCFRLIVTSPEQPHVTLSTIAAFATKTKFVFIYATLLALVGLSVAVSVRWFKKRKN